MPPFARKMWTDWQGASEDWRVERVVLGFGRGEEIMGEMVLRRKRADARSEKEGMLLVLIEIVI